jgi:DNA-binding NarL/FixJ family response regulator
LRLIGLGLDNAAISETLVISRNTVKKHVQHILAKLEVSDRTKAAIWAVQHGIGSTPDLP